MSQKKRQKKIAQDFVSSQVKPYVNQENSSAIVKKADSLILKTQRIDNNWNVYIEIRTNETGIVKKGELQVIVDGNNGKIVKVLQIKNQLPIPSSLV
jgi:hypothetical protein